MSKENKAEGQEEEELPGESGEEKEEKEQEGEKPAKQKAKLAGVSGLLNAKAAALAIAFLIVGIVVGQVALPGLGIGLISLSGEPATLDMAALQQKVQSYLEESVDPTISVTVASLEPVNDDLFSSVAILEKDGQKQYVDLYVTKDGLTMLAGSIQLLSLDEPLPPAQPPTIQPEPTEPPVVGELESFKDSGYDIELENGKPVVRLFSSTACGYCLWIRDTFEEVAKQYVAEGKIVAYHWELNTGDNTFTQEVESEVPVAEREIFDHFNPAGGVPTFVFGGKYYRIGVRYTVQDDLDAEAADFRAVIEALLQEAE